MAEIETEATTGALPVVAQVYTNQPCTPQSGGGMVTPLAVIDAGKGGPALFFWQGSATTQTAPIPSKLVPVVNQVSVQAAATAAFVNTNSLHRPLVRRRALVPPLQPGQSFLQVVSSPSAVTDGNDTVNMVALYLGDMSSPPQVRLAQWGTAAGTNGEYCNVPFSCGGGLLLVSVDCTGWTNAAGTQIGATLYLDGEPVGNTSLNASLGTNHLPMVGTDLVLYNVSAGGHTLALMADKNTICDYNDVWSLTVTELQGGNYAHQYFSQTPCPVQSGGTQLASAPYTPRGGMQIVMVAVSGYTTVTGGQLLQAHVLVDGDPVGSLDIYASQPKVHLPLVGGDIAIGKMPPGQHLVEIVADDGMCTDSTDTISLTILEVFP